MATRSKKNVAFENDSHPQRTSDPKTLDSKAGPAKNAGRRQTLGLGGPADKPVALDKEFQKMIRDKNIQRNRQVLKEEEILDEEEEAIREELERLRKEQAAMEEKEKLKREALEEEKRKRRAEKERKRREDEEERKRLAAQKGTYSAEEERKRKMIEDLERKRRDLEERKKKMAEEDARRRALLEADDKKSEAAKRRASAYGVLPHSSMRVGENNLGDSQGSRESQKLTKEKMQSANGMASNSGKRIGDTDKVEHLGKSNNQRVNEGNSNEEESKKGMQPHSGKMPGQIERENQGRRDSQQTNEETEIEEESVGEYERPSGPPRHEELVLDDEDEEQEDSKENEEKEEEEVNQKRINYGQGSSGHNGNYEKPSQRGMEGENERDGGENRNRKDLGKAAKDERVLGNVPRKASGQSGSGLEDSKGSRRESDDQSQKKKSNMPSKTEPIQIKKNPDYLMPDQKSKPNQNAFSKANQPRSPLSNSTTGRSKNESTEPTAKKTGKLGQKSPRLSPTASVISFLSARGAKEENPSDLAKFRKLEEDAAKIIQFNFRNWMLRKKARYPKAIQVDIGPTVNPIETEREEVLQGMKDWLKILQDDSKFKDSMLYATMFHFFMHPTPKIE